MSTTVTQPELAAAFTEWDRRYREEPERFQSEAVHLLKGTPETYGERCAPYLLAILAEQRTDDVPTIPEALGDPDDDERMLPCSEGDEGAEAWTEVVR